MTYSQSAGGIVLNSRRQVILVSQFGVSWSFPKGRVEEGEEVIEAAKREIYEETGVKDLKLIKALKEYERHPMKGPHNEMNFNHLKTISLFVFTTEQEELNPIDPDNPEARWVHIEEVTQLLSHEKDREFFEEIKDSL